MKNIRYISALIMACTTVISMSCKDDEAIRVPEVMDAANVRIQIEPDRSYYDFQDIDNAYLGYSIYTENTDIQSIEISFQYVNSVAEDTTDAQIIRTYTQADFVNGVIASQQITAAELATALEITTADLSGGDQFLFLNVTTLTDGRVYPSATVDSYQSVPADVRLASATASFTTVFDAIVGCPTAAPFTGTYLLEQVSGPEDVFNGDASVFSPGEVEIELTNPIGRTFNAGYYEGASFDFDTDVAFTLLCGEIIVSPVDTGIGCGGPRFTYQSVGSNPYDPADDSEIIINLMHNTTGACGLPANEPLTLKLTKQ
jgi:hypothetical protein